jgi:hypothetical protein
LRSQKGQRAPLSTLLPPSLTISAEDILDTSSWQLLAYGVPEVPVEIPGQLEERKIPSVDGGKLEQLRRLSVWLANQYGWTEAQATTFIVTGLPPLRLPITVRTEQKERLPGLSVIQLTVDPGVSPKEVADAYLEERKRLLGTRHRDLTEKHLALAVFVATQPPQRSWADRMVLWNKLSAGRGWGYTQVANFSHDCLQAQRRLLRSETPIVGTAQGGARAQSQSGGTSRDEAEEAGYVEAWAK